MTTVEYTEGGAQAIVRGDTVVLLPVPVDAELVGRLWAALSAGSTGGRHAGGGGNTPAGVVAVVGVLAQAAAALTDIPPFAVATWDGASGTARVAVRGATASVVVGTGSGPVEVSGADVLMWAERVVEGAISVDVRTSDAGGADGAPAWPLVGGVVRAAGLRVGTAVPAAAPDGPAGPESSAAATDPSEWPVPGQKVGAVRAPAAAPAVPDEVPDAVSGLVTDAVPGHETLIGDAEDLPAPADGGGSEPADEPAHDGTDAPAVTVSEDTVLGDDDEDGYEHLFGDTVFRRVEDAAVRTTEEDEHEEDAPPHAEPPSTPVPPSALVPPEPGPPAPEPGPLAAPGGLIAQVPGAASVPQPAPQPSPLAGTPGAVSRAAAVSADEAPVPSGDQDPGAVDDHDGHTIMSGELAALREAAGGVPQFSVPATPGAQDVLALSCPQGHPNPPTRERCRTCLDPLDGEPHRVPRPLLGRILVSSGTATGGVNDVDGGQAVELDRDVVVGRRPRTSTTSADRMPRLVTVTSPQQDISRSHVEVTLEEWHVLVEDLATTNGTMLLRPGQEPRRLHPNQKEIVADGDVVELGDGVALTFEGIW